MANPVGPRTRGLHWARELAESTTPVFLLNRKRQFILFNAGCSRRTGWPADEVIGQTCDYVTESDPHSREAILAACAPPAEVWQGRPAETPVFLPRRFANPEAVRIRFDPLLDDNDGVTLVMGRILPADEPVSSLAPTPAQALHAELAALRQQIRRHYSDDSIIAVSPAMRRVAAQLAAARHAAGCVLFTGEAGSGREHLARVLHARRPHGKRAFVPVDCQRAPSTELKRLLKHLADDREEVEALRMGTLFLKNIASAPRDVQDRLAEWLAAVASDQGPRIMAATDRSLEELTERDEFHRELYFLLTTFVIEVPPLRKRSQDVLPLAQYFLEEGNRAAEKQLSGFSPDAMDALRRYYWPGNVAELREVVRAAAASAAGPLVTESDFPLAFRVGQENQRIGPPPAKPLLPLEATLEQVEREQIQAALAACRNNLSKAANLLGVSRPKLYRRLEALGLLPDAKET